MAAGPRRPGTHGLLPGLTRYSSPPDRCRGKRRALVAVGNSILTIAHRLLSHPPPGLATSAPTGTTGSHPSAASTS
jgi:hypothetical protein